MKLVGFLVLVICNRSVNENDRICKTMILYGKMPTEISEGISQVLVIQIIRRLILENKKHFQ